MTGTSVAAMLLAAAVVVMPVPAARGLRGATRPTVPAVPMLLAVAVPVMVAVAMLPVPTLLAVLVGVVTMVIRRRRGLHRRRIAEEGQALVAALDVLVGELRVGAHPVRAFEVAARESAGVVRAVLSGVAARARLGADVASGLDGAAAGSVLRVEWRRMALAWRMAAEHGLGIGAVMRAVQADIVERQRFWTRVQAGLAGARATAAILAGLPLVGVVAGQCLGANPIGFLTGAGAGSWLLLAGVLLGCVGLLWADDIIERLPG